MISLRLYDDIEVEGMRRVYHEGEEYHEPVSDSNEKPEFWTVFGHLLIGGRETLCDCETEESAEVIAKTLRELLLK